MYLGICVWDIIHDVCLHDSRFGDTIGKTTIFLFAIIDRQTRDKWTPSRTSSFDTIGCALSPPDKLSR
jgi:hypothetical protein